jgi:fatty-acyl-CoA synthase
MMRTWVEKTLWQALEDTVTTNPDNLAIICEDQKLTYKEFRRKVEHLSIGLLKIGVRKGDKVSVWCPNCPEWIMAKFAIASIGAVLVPISTRFKIYELSYVLKHSDSTTLIIGERILNVDFAEITKEIIPEVETNKAGELKSTTFPLLKNIICVGNPRYEGIFSYKVLENLGDDQTYQNKLEGIRNSISPDDTVNMLYTSGTTGMPKGVRLTHNLLSNAFYVGEELRLTPDDRLLLYLPFNHCFAIINGVCGSIIHGSTIVVMDPFEAEDSLKTIEKQKVTVLFGVPTMYLAQIEHPHFNRYNVTSLRIGMIGGAGAPPAMIQKMMDRMGIGLISTYGMTEASCAVTQSRYGDSAKLISETVGLPLPHVEMKVFNTKTGQTVPYNVEGEICIRGYSLTKGYYKNEEETKKLIDKEGWIHSGDLGTVDDEGYYRITGRIKDLIIRGGENIAPAEIEDFIYQHPDVQQVQVVGAPDEKLGEVVAAFIVIKEGKALTAEDVISFCKGKIASFKIPSIIRFVSEFPTTSSGKIKKFELKKAVGFKEKLS